MYIVHRVSVIQGIYFDHSYNICQRFISSQLESHLRLQRYGLNQLFVGRTWYLFPKNEIHEKDFEKKEQLQSLPKAVHI